MYEELHPKSCRKLAVFFKHHLLGMRFERDHGEEQRLLARTIHGDWIQESDVNLGPRGGFIHTSEEQYPSPAPARMPASHYQEGSRDPPY